MAWVRPSAIEAYAASVTSRTWRACSAVRTGSSLAAQAGDEMARPGLDDPDVVRLGTSMPCCQPSLARRAVVVDVQADRVIVVVARAR